MPTGAWSWRWLEGWGVADYQIVITGRFSVATVMFSTTILIAVQMKFVKHLHVLVALGFFLFFGFLDGKGAFYPSTIGAHFCWQGCSGAPRSRRYPRARMSRSSLGLLCA